MLKETMDCRVESKRLQTEAASDRAGSRTAYKKVGVVMISGFTVGQVYCKDWEECADGLNCPWALDLQIILEAEHYNKPVKTYLTHPNCFKELENDH